MIDAPGATLAFLVIVDAIWVPSGDQAISDTPSSKSVIVSASPPSIGINAS